MNLLCNEFLGKCMLWFMTPLQLTVLTLALKKKKEYPNLLLMQKCPKMFLLLMLIVQLHNAFAQSQVMEFMFSSCCLSYNARSLFCLRGRQRFVISFCALFPIDDGQKSHKGKHGWHLGLCCHKIMFRFNSTC